jgi:NAD-dependent dihydropyrimidine dehydrogenase PreA subunit
MNAMGSYGTWRGVAREQIPWFPTVDVAKCAGCKECFNFCKHGVYAWDDANNKPVVAQPFHCVVGCGNCAGQCEQGAITFPPLTILKDIRR